MKTRYRFIGRSADGRSYSWGAFDDGITVEIISCPVKWFWNPRGAS